MELIVIKPPENFNPSHLICNYAVGGSSQTLDFELRTVKFKKKKEELKEARRLYRREYMSRPEVKAKIKKRLENPKVIEARRIYAENPKVKERKKFLSKRSRELRNLLKNENPELYNSYLDKITPMIGPTPEEFMNPPAVDHFTGKVNVMLN